MFKHVVANKLQRPTAFEQGTGCPLIDQTDEWRQNQHWDANHMCNPASESSMMGAVIFKVRFK